MRILRPQYLYRPQQLFVRLWRTVRPPATRVQRVRLPWGLPLEIDTGDALGGWIWRTGVYDLVVSEVVWRLLGPGTVAVDGGANIGYMTSLMAKRAERVWAFEPHPAVFQRLAANVADFRRHGALAQVRLEQSALSDVTGTATLIAGAEFADNQGTAHLGAAEGTPDTPDTPDTAGCAAAGCAAAGWAPEAGIAVACWRLDEVFSAQVGGITLLKLDVEGHEAQVLRGATDLLRAGRIEHIVYEAHAGPRSPLHGWLAAYGYQVFALGWNVRGPCLAPADVMVARPDEPPSYLATRMPETARARLGRRGWAVLGRFSG